MSEQNIPEDDRLSRPEFDEGPEPEQSSASLMDLLARGAEKHRLLTVVVLFQAMLLVAGTVLIVGTIIYRASAPQTEITETEDQPDQ